MNGTSSNWISPRAVLFAEHFDLAYREPEPGEIEFLVRRIQEGGEPDKKNSSIDLGFSPK